MFEEDKDYFSYICTIFNKSMFKEVVNESKSDKSVKNMGEENEPIDSIEKAEEDNRKKKNKIVERDNKKNFGNKKKFDKNNRKFKKT